MAIRAPGPDFIYRFDDVEVRTGARSLARGGVLVGVEPKAFSVLVELLAHAGETVTRDALLDHVWGHRHVTSGVLNRIIAQLRRALGDDAGHPHLIRTVHGLGYGFMRPVERRLAGDGEEPVRTAVPEAAASVWRSAH